MLAASNGARSVLRRWWRKEEAEEGFRWEGGGGGRFEVRRSGDIDGRREVFFYSCVQ